MASYARTALLLAGLTAFFLTIGYFIGGQAGMMIALLIALGLNLFAYWNADKMVLRMHGARRVDEQSAPAFVSMVRDLAANAGLPMPAVYIIDNPQPNAFATGRDPQHAAVAATSGLLNMLSREEIAGVMAHELAHVKNHDTLIMTVTATIAGAIGMLANFAFFFGGNRDNNNSNFVTILLVSLLAPIAAMIVQMAISRTREYEADRIGAEICGRPDWLASALRKIAGGAARIENPAAEANPATAHMFIINPLHGRRMDGLFTTHPNTDNRISRLMAMTGGGSGLGSSTGGQSTGSVPSFTARGTGPSRGPWG